VIAQNVTFWILAVAMVLAAIGVVRSRNVVHAALYLVVVMAGAAAQYILLAAEFVAWVQVIIYIGAVIILFLFGIMLTRAPMGGDTELDNDQRWPAAVVALFLAGVIASLLIDAFGKKEIVIEGAKGRQLLHVGNANTLGDLIFRSYVVPFEVVSILLLAALVGAVVIARRD
jgi:NADH-quinone oxidoreductase subunit J